MQDLGLCCAQLVVRHRAVTGAKIHRSFGHLANPAAAADRLIVDLHVRMCLAVFAEPFLINRVGERSARAGQLRLAESRNGEK